MRTLEAELGDNTDAKQTIKILRLVCPSWIKELEKVNFDSSKLKSNCLHNLNSVGSACMVGEIHNLTDEYYLRGNNPCKQCVFFCQIIPDAMDPTVSHKWDIQSLFAALAEHIKKSHPKIMKDAKKRQKVEVC